MWGGGGGGGGGGAFHVVENLRSTSTLLVTEQEFFQLQAKELSIKS